MIKTIGYAAKSATTPLELFTFERREPGDHDVQIEILYCGVCHSDIEFARNEWQNAIYPVVPGHEIIGRVTDIGNKITSFKIGDFAAVGVFVDSCGTCAECKNHLEQYCQKAIMTFNSFDKHTNGLNYGGYSKRIVVDEKFVLHIPEEFKKEDIASIAPLLCAGITTYSALKHWKVGKGQKVGIVGIGGLGHLAIQIAHALGADVVAVTTSPDKKNDAKRFGANETILSTNLVEMKKYLNSFDFVLNTIPVSHNLSIYLSLLKLDGTMCLLGIPSEAHAPLSADNLILQRKSLAGSLVGGIQETQEMLDFCAKHDIRADIELIPMQKINESFEEIINKKVRYRYVIDMASL